MKKENDLKIVPVVYEIKSQKLRSNTSYSVHLTNKFIKVNLIPNGRTMEVNDEPSLEIVNKFQGLRLHWSGNKRAFIKKFFYEAPSITRDDSEDALHRAFRGYLITWYCKRGETVI